MSTKPLIVILCLKFEEGFDQANAHLLSVLAQRDVVRKAWTPSQARRYLMSTTRPHAVILADAEVTEPMHHELLARLVEYAEAGGTVIYAGPFTAASLYPDINSTFKTAWGLQWSVSAACGDGTFAVNPQVKGLNTKGLVKRCKFQAAIHVDNVALEDAVYISAALAKKGGNGSSSHAVTYKTPAAFGKIGRGRVGYVGDMHGEPATTNLILAMCFWPGSRAPIPPGDGVPEVFYTGLAFVEEDAPPHPSTSDATDLGPKRNILIVSLEKEDYTDEIYAQFYQALRKNATVTEVQQPRAAQAALSASASASPRPDAVILSDPALTNPKHKKLLASLVDYTRSGGTVVLALQFSNHLKPAQTRPFFARWGVPWDRGSYFRTTTALNPAGIPAPLNSAALLPSVSAKAVHVKDAPRAHAVYLPTAASHVESRVFARDPITGEMAQESPAVCARVGEGYLGYVGDVNGEQGSTRLIFEMCGVKLKPGDLGTRTVSTGINVFPDGRREAITEVEVEVPLPAPAPPPREPRPRDAEVAGRAAARGKVREEKRVRADALKVEGNDLFKQEKWKEAAEKYREAAFLGGPQPVYLSNLAACLLKLDMWDLADSAATRALMYDPKHVKALYRRALARKDLDRLNAALADLEWLLTIDKFNTSALQERLTGSIDWPGDDLVRSKRDGDVAIEIEDESDSEDFAHPGTGIACRYYNTGETGCRNGKTCRFRHAPDSKSVRDELGRNVCVYWLLGHCRFAAAGKCVYAHDATYLPERGWWMDTARLERMRADFDAAVQEEPLDLGAGRVEERILAEALVPPSWRKDLWAVASYDYPLGSDEDDEDDYHYGYEGGHDAEQDYYDEEERRELDRLGVAMGVDRDFEEMLEYGIKPWEDDAYEELMSIRHALSRLY
ncbi:transporter [Ganoderma sinense ZZ0214-1]|uniref:Transporter n=1 Tax=Ganoderma sinense ZZ0214-1 TaxID=1077348 RepID=A0A2G8SFI0_9APHY|nr:transporter [Ganoderma sinense ZZ0214-1]